MKASQACAIAALAAAIVFFSQASYAFDLTGAWTTDASGCAKIFRVNKDKTLSIRAASDMYGDGFIVRGNAITASGGTCIIKARKSVGPITHLVAKCAAENVAFSTFQFSYRVKDDNSIVRVFPGIEELDVAYHRCVF
jgi:hypothetical protein